jgi:hypothetical protein
VSARSYHSIQNFVLTNIRNSAAPEQTSSPLKRKRGSLKVASVKRQRIEEISGPSTSTPRITSHTFTTSTTPIPASAMSHKVPSADRQFHDFQWRMLTLCGEFYDAATKLVVSPLWQRVFWTLCNKIGLGRCSA